MAKQHHLGATLIAAAALVLSACNRPRPTPAPPAEPAPAEVAVSRFESILASGGPLYELSHGRCRLWTVSAANSSMSQVVGDGRTIVYELSYTPTVRALRLGGPHTTFDEPPPAEKPGWGIIGRATLCTQEVQITGARDGQAIRFGDRSWFFSREPCKLASRPPPTARQLPRSPMCHDRGRSQLLNLLLLHRPPRRPGVNDADASKCTALPTPVWGRSLAALC